mmetsp:Transcript_13835/g.43212  ORF Transcript_13835/g.43212 Transcript_13835/m.43212 type:complete len:100 (-) Transcript_13835:62-361(-)
MRAGRPGCGCARTGAGASAGAAARVMAVRGGPELRGAPATKPTEVSPATDNTRTASIEAVASVMSGLLLPEFHLRTDRGRCERRVLQICGAGTMQVGGT